MTCRWPDCGSARRGLRCLAAGLLALCAVACDALHAPPSPPEADADRSIPIEPLLDKPRQGSEYQSPEIQALQHDAFANPGLLWVDNGKSLWVATPEQGRPCASCHGDIHSMRGVATRYPRVDPDSSRLVNLTQRIQACRIAHQNTHDDYESQPLLGLTAAVTAESAGMPFDVSVDGDARAFFDRGRQYYYERRGQMHLACHNCHEQNAGRMLRGDRLSQGHSTGYPAYRLQWQSLGSLHRRLRFCNQGIRAEPFDYGAPEYVNLELFLAWRAAGLTLTAPAVRP